MKLGGVGWGEYLTPWGNQWTYDVDEYCLSGRVRVIQLVIRISYLDTGTTAKDQVKHDDLVIGARMVFLGFTSRVNVGNCLGEIPTYDFIQQLTHTKLDRATDK